MTRPAPARCLAVTSSTGVMSLAIGDVWASDMEEPDGARVAVLASIDIATERRHAEEITPRLAELLDRTSTAPDAIDRLVVDIGPGRFTGLRVGLATVRAMAFGLGVPVVPLTSLEILALAPVPDGAVGGHDGGADGDAGRSVTAVVDARRQEVFQQVFVDGAPAGPAIVGSSEALAGQARGAVVGDGADRYREHYTAAGLTVLGGRNPDAAIMLGIAANRAARPGNEIEPLYLRGPDANPNVKTRPTVAGATTGATTSGVGR